MIIKLQICAVVLGVIITNNYSIRVQISANQSLSVPATCSVSRYPTTSTTTTNTSRSILRGSGDVLLLENVYWWEERHVVMWREMR